MGNASLEIGNGKWATKEGKLLGYNINDRGKFRPIEGDVDRDCEATYTDRDGLIKTAQPNVARIDFSENPNGVMLLEDAATNLITYSEDFSKWIDNGRLSYNQTNEVLSPDDEMTAFKIISTDNAEGQLFLSTTNTSGLQSFSVYMRKGSVNFGYILCLEQSFTGGVRQWFDLDSGFVGVNTSFGSGVVVDSAKIESLNDDWYRCTLIVDSIYTAMSFRICLTNSNGSTSGLINDYIYIFGAQSEDNGATSYIPTNGSTVVRLADIVTVDTSLITPTPTEIIETIDGIEQPPITTIPPTYQISEGNINSVIMN